MESLYCRDLKIMHCDGSLLFILKERTQIPIAGVLDVDRGVG